MKNHYLKKTFIVVISALLFSSCATPTNSTSKSTPTTLDPDAHPQLSFNYGEEVTYTKKEFKILDAEKILIDSLYIQVAYELSPERWLLIARNQNFVPEGLKLLLINPTLDNELIYRSKGAYESMILHPTFFLPDNKNEAWIILCALGTSESWGQNLFFMDGDVINEIAYLDIAIKEESESLDYDMRLLDIAPTTSIRKNNDGFHFTFETDSLIYFGSLGDKDDPIIKGSSFEYVFFEDGLNAIYNP